VLESWQPSEQRPARINIPVLIENRIEVLRQAVLLLNKHHSHLIKIEILPIRDQHS
jgi:hypothetical protein